MLHLTNKFTTGKLDKEASKASEQSIEYTQIHNKLQKEQLGEYTNRSKTIKSNDFSLTGSSCSSSSIALYHSESPHPTEIVCSE